MTTLSLPQAPPTPAAPLQVAVEVRGPRRGC